MHYFFVYQLLHVPLETYFHYWSAVAIEMCIYFTLLSKVLQLLIVCVQIMP